ncbi:MAG: 3-dehydroquinate synthase [Opitutus sp.]
MVHELNVEVGDRRYPIILSDSAVETVRAKVKELLSTGRKVAVVTDAHVRDAQKHAFAAMFEATPLLAVEAGEGAKSLETLGAVLDFLAANRIDRAGAVFAVGGGVVGDLAGFAAASWLRGIDLYQIPTTLLAMVDSSVGGKTGINIPAGKNLVGAFHQPRGVYIGTDLLQTLPPREFAAGMAEVIKYGLLGDPALFDQLERDALTVASVDLAKVIRRCCELKAAIVAADERETAVEGGRALLNLGHTFGHAIEQVAGYGVYLHGEAVAIGLAAAGRLSHHLGHLKALDVERIDRVLVRHSLPTRLRSALGLPDLFGAMSRDKKVRGGMPRFVVLKSLGHAITQDGISLDLAEKAFRAVGAE